MKKLLKVLLTLGLVFTMSACSNNSSDSKNNNKQKEESTIDAKEQLENCIVKREIMDYPIQEQEDESVTIWDIQDNKIYYTLGKNVKDDTYGKGIDYQSVNVFNLDDSTTKVIQDLDLYCGFNSGTGLIDVIIYDETPLYLYVDENNDQVLMYGTQEVLRSHNTSFINIYECNEICVTCYENNEDTTGIIETLYAFDGQLELVESCANGLGSLGILSNQNDPLVWTTIDEQDNLDINYYKYNDDQSYEVKTFTLPHASYNTLANYVISDYIMTTETRSDDLLAIHPVILDMTNNEKYDVEIVQIIDGKEYTSDEITKTLYYTTNLLSIGNNMFIFEDANSNYYKGIIDSENNRILYMLIEDDTFEFYANLCYPLEDGSFYYDYNCEGKYYEGDTLITTGSLEFYHLKFE